MASEENMFLIQKDEWCDVIGWSIKKSQKILLQPAPRHFAMLHNIRSENLSVSKIQMKN